MLADKLAGAQIVALDPDEGAQQLAAYFLTGGDVGRLGGDGMHEEESEARPPPPRLPYSIYPALHVSSNWAGTSHRLASVSVPDVSLDDLRRVEQTANVTFAVGSVEAAASSFLSGGRPFSENVGDGDEEHEEARAGDDFDAIATCFVLDVLSDPLLALKAFHAMLSSSRGLWVNLGPLAFPDPHEGQPAPMQDAEKRRRGVALTASQQLALVAHAGFEVIDQRLLENCEYNSLPHRLERVVRACLYFVARPRAAPGSTSSHQPPHGDEL